MNKTTFENHVIILPKNLLTTYYIPEVFSEENKKKPFNERFLIGVSSKYDINIKHLSIIDDEGFKISDGAIYLDGRKSGHVDSVILKITDKEEFEKVNK